MTRLTRQNTRPLPANMVSVIAGRENCKSGYVISRGSGKAVRDDIQLLYLATSANNNPNRNPFYK